MCARSSKQPSRDELRGAEYLKVRGYKAESIVYEPNGRDKAPDFGIDQRIAVEVMRLTEYVLVDGGHVALESGAISLTRCVKQFLHTYVPTFPSVSDEPSWFVHFNFSRPLQTWDVVEPYLKTALEEFGRSDRELLRYDVTPKFRISLLRGGTRYDSYFRFGGSSDRDSGGFVIPLLADNTAISLNRKSEILEGIKGYSERWLLLIDYVASGTWDAFEIPRSNWDRVILVSPEGPMSGYEPPWGVAISSTPGAGA